MSDEILFEIRGHAGFVTLNRPKALNALNHDMVKDLSAKLDAWAQDSNVHRVVITGAGEKAFCAGGDIRSIYDARRAGETDHLTDFFRDEYLLNAKIKSYPKPYIAVIDGIVMGGGVGVSVHGTYRVGTEFTTFAMPETGIGFFPDVGGTYFLPRMPQRTGVYCALTAGRLKQPDAFATGILTHTVKRSGLSDLLADLEKEDVTEALIGAHHQDPGESGLMSRADLIEDAFGGASVDSILACLAADESEWASKTADAIRAKSPTSVHIAFEQMQRGADLSFKECMTLEYRIVSKILQGHDFFEGVRAVLVDKDHDPKWSPAGLNEVDSAELSAYFEEPEGGDLPL
ncbi:enoyl-CoA hydratase [Roseibium hamelinense]|uniref:3-hydroxyisobutyryl-CoA hydrolase n=1 Tax=Roseibium hamelinense TaxID=150831 RepID=A0A562TIX3_9HYPH|nr:enoyl-CoA hydratase/isomerase family protein [Roseibium hamelinense]MTI42395.1 enoyl-CoA hydratase/isomerase family protein [Roseibium hamelinense]TWI92600.1 enoyl-CoA hydratase [Roseibium hamelinense]